MYVCSCVRVHAHSCVFAGCHFAEVYILSNKSKINLRTRSPPPPPNRFSNAVSQGAQEQFFWGRGGCCGFLPEYFLPIGFLILALGKISVVGGGGGGLWGVWPHQPCMPMITSMHIHSQKGINCTLYTRIVLMPRFQGATSHFAMLTVHKVRHA